MATAPWTAASISADSTSTVEFGGSFTTGTATLSITGGARVGINGGTLSGTLTLPAGQALEVDAPSTLDDLTLNGNLDLTQLNRDYVDVYDGWTLNGTAYVGAADGSTLNGINFIGTQTVAGTGSIAFGGVAGSFTDNYIVIEDNTALTLGPDITVHGSEGEVAIVPGSTLVNQGMIDADVAGGEIEIDYPVCWTTAACWQRRAGTCRWCRAVGAARARARSRPRPGAWWA